MIDDAQQQEIIGAFERAGMPAGSFDFSAEIDQSLTLEENLTQLEEKTGFKAALKGQPIEPENWRLERMIARFLGRGYEMEIKDSFEKGQEVNRLVFTKRNTASYAAAPRKTCPSCHEWPLEEGDLCEHCQKMGDLRQPKPVCKVKKPAQDMVIVRMRKAAQGYQEGEAAALPREEAEGLIKCDICALAGGYDVPDQAAPELEAIKAPVSEVKEASIPKNGMIYAEGMEISEPIRGKDGRDYVLFLDEQDENTWNVLSVKPPKKNAPVGAMDYDVGCLFATYREAWLYLQDCLAGKAPDCETWKAPKEASA